MDLQKNINKSILNKILDKYHLGEVKTFKQLSGGFANPALLINETYVIRFNAGDKNSPETGIHSGFTRESILYPILEKLHIPTPTFVALDNSKEVISYFYIINSYIKGDSLTTKYATLDNETKSSTAFALGKILQKIHSVKENKISEKASLFRHKLPWKEKIIKEFNNTYRLFIAHKNDLSDIDRKTIETTYHLFQEQIQQEDIPLGLIHHDFHANHVIIDKKEIKGIIDFEWACIGDPLWDFQKLPINLTIKGHFSIKDFLRGYGISKFSEKDSIRLKTYCFLQALWQIDNTKHGGFGYPEEAIKDGYDLIKKSELL